MAHVLFQTPKLQGPNNYVGSTFELQIDFDFGTIKLNWQCQNCKKIAKNRRKNTYFRTFFSIFNILLFAILKKN